MEEVKLKFMVTSWTNNDKKTMYFYSDIEGALKLYNKIMSTAKEDEIAKCSVAQEIITNRQSY